MDWVEGEMTGRGLDEIRCCMRDVVRFERLTKWTQGTLPVAVISVIKFRPNYIIVVSLYDSWAIQ